MPSTPAAQPTAHDSWARTHSTNRPPSRMNCPRRCSTPRAGTVTLNALRYPLAAGQAPGVPPAAAATAGGRRPADADGRRPGWPAGRQRRGRSGCAAGHRPSGRHGGLPGQGQGGGARMAADDTAGGRPARGLALVGQPAPLGPHGAGNCSQPDTAPRVLHEGSARGANPQSLALVSGPAQHTLSFVVGRRLCQVRWAVQRLAGR